MTEGFGTICGALEVAVTVNVWFSFNAPEEMPLRLIVCRPESSSMTRSFQSNRSASRPAPPISRSRRRRHRRACSTCVQRSTQTRTPIRAMTTWQ